MLLHFVEIGCKCQNC